MNNKEIQKITTENSHDIIQEIESAFFDIPFENSKFQTETFVLAAQITPERAYRAIGLRMHAKLRALNEAKFGRLKHQVDIDEIDYKLQNENLSSFDRRREEIKKQEILSQVNWTNKLINDAIAELNVLYYHFNKLPRYTRDQFEQAEKLHFEQRLNRQALGLAGAKESLINIHEDAPALGQYEQEVSLLENATSDQLLNLVQALPNLLKEKNHVL